MEEAMFLLTNMEHPFSIIYSLQLGTYLCMYIGASPIGSFVITLW